MWFTEIYELFFSLHPTHSCSSKSPLWHWWINNRAGELAAHWKNEHLSAWAWARAYSMIVNVFIKRHGIYIRAASKSQVRETLMENEARAMKWVKERKSALRMVQTIVGGIGVRFPSIMQRPLLVAVATRAPGQVREKKKNNRWYCFCSQLTFL